MEGWELVIN